MREIGVFCGTFNPIHWGHLMLAEFARDQFRLEKVYIVTSPNPPHRHQDLLDAESRHELVIAACQDNQFFEPSRIELDRPGPSFTVDTLRAIKDLEEAATKTSSVRSSAENSDNSLRLNFLVGQDNLLALKDWHEASALFSLCRILVATRTSTVTREEVEREVPTNASFELIEFPQVPVSSSTIRTRIRSDKTIMYLVPPAVNNIIEEKDLYKNQTVKAPAGRMKHARHTKQS